MQQDFKYEAKCFHAFTLLLLLLLLLQFRALARFPAGCREPPHTHTHSQELLVLSGALLLPSALCYLACCCLLHCISMLLPRPEAAGAVRCTAAAAAAASVPAAAHCHTCFCSCACKLLLTTKQAYSCTSYLWLLSSSQGTTLVQHALAAGWHHRCAPCSLH
jgi:hypothetical protein